MSAPTFVDCPQCLKTVSADRYDPNMRRCGDCLDKYEMSKEQLEYEQMRKNAEALRHLLEQAVVEGAVATGALNSAELTKAEWLQKVHGEFKALAVNTSPLPDKFGSRKEPVAVPELVWGCG